MIVLSPIAEARRRNTLKLLQNSGLSQKELASSLDMHASLLSAYLSKKPKKSIGDKVAKRISSFFNIDPRKLDVDAEYIQQQNFEKNNIIHNLIDIPLYLESPNKPKKFTIFKSELDENNINIKDVKALLADGDSMYPRIPHNAKIFFDTSKTLIRDGGIYIVANGGLLFIRNIFKMPNDQLRLVSSNSDKTLYPDLYISSLECQVIGQVFYVAYKITD